MDPTPIRLDDKLPPPPPSGGTFGKASVYGGGVSALLGALMLLDSHEGQLGGVAILFGMIFLGVSGFAVLAGRASTRESLDARIDKAMAPDGRRRPAPKPGSPRSGG